VEAATRAAEHALAIGDFRRADTLATRATDLDALAEGAWRVRMSARQADGDRSGALRHYQSCRRALADELGIEPAATTHELFLQILQTDESREGDLNDVVAAVLAAARELAASEATTGRDDITIALLHRAERLAKQVKAVAPRVIAPRLSPDRLIGALAATG
jgi:DNA-binding SARP family transcriptional activator